MDPPAKFYIPPLWAGVQAQLIWKPVAGASGYRIEANADESAWQQAFLGPGISHDSPDLGLPWSILDSSSRTWANIDLADKSWDEFERLGGVTLAWESRDAYGKTWAQQDGEALSWDAWDALPIDTAPHLAAFFSVPAAAQRITFRIQAFNAAGQSSYFYTDAIPVAHRIECKFATAVSEAVALQVKAENIPSFEGVSYTMTYPVSKLQFQHLFFDTLSVSSDLYDAGRPQIKEISPGKIQFQLPAAVGAGNTWEGPIIQVLFCGLQDGYADVQFTKSMK